MTNAEAINAYPDNVTASCSDPDFPLVIGGGYHWLGFDDSSMRFTKNAPVTGGATEGWQVEIRTQLLGQELSVYAVCAPGA